jgi:hypothetical protein
MERIDEVALNVLLLDDQVEPATAFAASIEDSDPASRSDRFYFDVGLLIGVILAIWWLLF